MTTGQRTIEIYDTTLRDGTQGEGISLSLHDKLRIAQRLDEIGVDYIEGGYPLSNEKDVEFFRRVRTLGLSNAKVCAFGMTRRRGAKPAEDVGMRALLESEAPVCTIVGKTSAFHVDEILRVSRQENLDMIAESVGFLVQSGREVVYDAEHCFDGWKETPEYAAQTILAAAQGGAKRIAMCDTNGGSLPEEIARIVREARKALADAGYAAEIGIHTHNDGELAVANSLAAVGAGAVQVQGTINGFGERCGNADLISVMANLGLKQGYRVLGGRPLDRLTELSRFVYETANVHLRNNQPFVGHSAFAHKGGMHVHAVNRTASSYEHLDPALVGNERRILVSELSGRSNIVAMTQKFELHEDRELMDRILAEVVQLEAQGYQFEAAGGSFDLLVRRQAGLYRPHFDVIKYRVVAGDRNAESHAPFAEALVKLRVKGEDRFEAAEGDGPVDALNNAVRKALRGDFPELASMRLVDYKVRVVNYEAATAARIRVIVESADEHETWGTVGVSENIIEASWLALRDALEYKLTKHDGAPLPAPQVAAAT